MVGRPAARPAGRHALTDALNAYEQNVLYIHRLLTGVDILYRDVLQLQRKLDVLEILLAALSRLEAGLGCCPANLRRGGEKGAGFWKVSGAARPSVLVRSTFGRCSRCARSPCA